MIRFSSAASAAAADGFALDEGLTASHFAPSSIHCFTAATSAALSGLPCAGIDGCSSPAMRRYSRLASALPGTMSDPRVPPRSALSRVLRSSLPSCTVSP